MPVHTDVSTICSILMLLAFPGTFSASQGKRGLYAGAYRCLYYMFHINAASIPWNILCFTGEEGSICRCIQMSLLYVPY